MRVVMVITICFVLLTGSIAVFEASSSEKAATIALPPSLDKLYPPHVPAPIWLINMIEMSTAFSGTVSDFMEGDFANAEKGYASFRAQYANLSQVVPEWGDNLPMDPIEALGQALETRDMGVFMPAVESVSKVCHDCHVENMARAQQKYHWGDFQSIALTDPVSKEDVTFPVLMRLLDSDLSGVRVDLSQGQIDNARKHAAGLAARYGALKESCEACHDTERHYYVDSSIIERVERLNTALNTPEGNPGNTVPQLLQEIGMQSCHKCHMVHGPAALSRYAGASGEH